MAQLVAHLLCKQRVRSSSLLSSTNRVSSQSLEALFSCQKSAKIATEPGNFPANVPKKHQNSYKTRRKNSGKCSKKQPKQQQTPGIFRRMFQKMAEVATNAGEKTPANVPHKSVLSSSIETKTDLACVESTPCFQP